MREIFVKSPLSHGMNRLSPSYISRGIGSYTKWFSVDSARQSYLVTFYQYVRLYDALPSQPLRELRLHDITMYPRHVRELIAQGMTFRYIEEDT